MINQAYWFSHFCPHFSALHAEAFVKNFGPGSAVSEPLLNSSGNGSAARWFIKNLDQWKKFQDEVPTLVQDIVAKGYALSFWNEKSFPRKLRRLAHPPGLLFYRGAIEVLENPTVAVVGARHPTHLGRLWVQSVIPKLVEAGMTVVSGGARGIDSEAHWSALQSGGRTVAFLPGGVDEPYPRGNRFIFEKILKAGSLVSEYAPRTIVRPEHFHRRNRLIVGAADVVIVVEASMKSGTLMTANRALSENVDLMVVPGPPQVKSYEGSLELLMQGAPMARDERDIFHFLKWPQKAQEKNALKKNPESPSL